MSWTITIPYSTAAAATITNVLSGTAVEYIGAATTLTIYASADATGDTMSLFGFTGANPGSAYIPGGTPISAASTVGSVKTNENFLTQIAVPANTRLVLTVVTSAAHTGRFQIVVS